MSEQARVRVAVEGVGFRPFVHSLATRLGLSEQVGNDLHGVFAEVEGSPEVLEQFVSALRSEAPPLASIDRISTRPMSWWATGISGSSPATPVERARPSSPRTARRARTHRPGCRASQMRS